MVKQLGKTHKAMFNSFADPNDRSWAVMKMLMEVYPAFQKKLLEGNDLMQRLVMTGYSPMDILDYPICGKCETLAAYNDYGIKDGKKVPRCTCVKESCGASTLNPITLRAWIKYELKKRVNDEFIDAIEIATDYIAGAMINKHRKELENLMRDKRGRDKEKIGILMPDGSEHIIPEVKIEHHRDIPDDLPEDLKQLGDEDFV